MIQADRRRYGGLVIGGLALALGGMPAAAIPPKVTKAVPDNGATDVDPALKEIRVTFDQDMGRDGYSVCGGGEQFPKTIGKPRWASNRILVLRVRLEPEHEYALSINCPAAQGFTNKAGEPAAPYPISFKTGKAKGTATSQAAAANANAEAVKELRRAIDEDYSYRDLHVSNWDELFAKHQAGMEGAKNARAFADQAAMLLAKARDIHIWMTIGEQGIGTFKRSVPWNCDLEALGKLVPGWQRRSPCVYTGRFDDGIGYIMITTWSKSEDNPFKAAFAALAEFKDAKGLIVDVRPNAGGDERLAQEFAGCFIDKPVPYAKHVVRVVDAPGGFSKPAERILSPSLDRPRYRGKIAVLMGTANMSSCESFLLMMKQVAGCKLIGEKSYGASGNPRPHDLGNGVTVFLPTWKDLRLDGTCFENEGLTPDIPVKYLSAQRKTSDAVLDAALKYLRQP